MKRRDKEVFRKHQEPMPDWAIGPRALKDPHSREYALQTVNWLKTLWSMTVASLDDWDKALKEAESNQIWKTLNYSSFDDLLRKEIGVSRAESVAEFAGRFDKDDLLEPHRPKGNKKPDNIRVSNYGDDPEYLTKVIAQRHPEIHERMKAGEYESVRAAAIDAGIVSIKVSVRMDDAESAAKTLIKHMPVEVREKLVALLIKAMHEA